MTDSSEKRATLYDVAAYAGVSYQTVSRVINGNPHVSAKTLKRVQEAILALDYQPNKAARTLVTRRSYTLEVITVGTSHFGPAQMMTSVERAARGRGYKLIFTNIEDMRESEILDVLDGLNSVDGAIIITPIRNEMYDRLTQECPRPFVKVGAQPGIQLPSLVIDQALGSRLATRHLIALGHTEIAEIGGPYHWYDAAARHQGFLEELQASGLKHVPTAESDWTAAGGYDACLRLIASEQPFTALVVGNDQMALGAMRALREQGLRVPEDVSVVGFDDIPEAAYFEPPLTTVQQDFGALGGQAVEYLIEILNNPETPLHQRVLYPRLVVRQSTTHRK
jgi:LacI family transcriptional regulator